MASKDGKSKSPHPLSKFTDCAYFLAGNCVRGQSCHYRHCEAARVNASKNPPHICRVWAANQQDCANLNCKYAHPDPTKLAALGAAETKQPSPAVKKAPKPQSDHSATKEVTKPAPQSSGVAGPRLKTAVFWDIENCPIPRGHSAFSVANRVLEQLARLVPSSQVVSFSAFANAAKINHEQRISLHRGNVKLCDVPDPKPGAADRVLVEEVDSWCQMVPAPAVLCLVSGDIDYVRRLITYKGYGYTIVLFHNAQAREELKVTAHHAVPWTVVSSSETGTSKQKPAKQPKQEKEKSQKRESGPNKSAAKKASAQSPKVDGSQSPQKGKQKKPQQQQQPQQQQRQHGQPQQKQKQDKRPDGSRRKDAQPDDLETALKSLFSLITPIFGSSPKAGASQASVQSPHPKARGGKPATPAARQAQNTKKGEPNPKKQSKKQNQQKKSKVPVYKCGSCNSSFGASMSLEQHQESKKHWSCAVCSRSFNSGDALDQHQTDSDHMQLFCQVCSGGPFKSQKSCDDHKSALGHWNCPQCDSMFKTEQSLAQHQMDAGHYEDDSSDESSESSDSSSELSDDSASDDDDGDAADSSDDAESSDELIDIFAGLPWDSLNRMFSEKVLERERQLASSRNQPERVAAINDRMNALKQQFSSDRYLDLVQSIIRYDTQLLSQMGDGDAAAAKALKERLRIMETEVANR